MFELINWRYFFVFVVWNVGSRSYDCVVWIGYVVFGVNYSVICFICCIIVWYVKVVYFNSSVIGVSCRVVVFMIYRGYWVFWCRGVIILGIIIIGGRVKKMFCFWYYGVFIDVIVVICGCSGCYGCYCMRGYIVVRGMYYCWCLCGVFLSDCFLRVF